MKEFMIIKKKIINHIFLGESDSYKEEFEGLLLRFDRDK